MIMRALRSCLIGAWFLAATQGPASAFEKLPELEGRVARAVEAGLPAGLALAGVEMPGGLSIARTATVGVSWSLSPRPGVNSVMVSVATPSGQAKRWAKVRLTERRLVAVARRDIRAGERVDARDIAPEMRPLENGRLSPLAPELIKGLEARIEIKRGEVLDEHHVLMPAPLPRGHEVQVVLRAASAQISVSGRLERPARPGDLVSVHAREGNRLLRGRLIDASTVVVEVKP